MILYVYPHRGFVTDISSILCAVWGTNVYARLFTLLVPVNVAMIYNATLHLVMEIEDHALVCDELIFRIKKKLLSVL